MNKALAVIVVLSAFLPSSFEYGFYLQFKDVEIPIFYLLVILLMLAKLPTLVSGGGVIPAAPLFLLYAMVHSLCTLQAFTGNGLLGILKGVLPPLVMLLAVGNWQRLPGFEKHYKSLWIYLLPFVAYVLVNCFVYSWVVAHGFLNWGGVHVDSGIPGVNRAALPFGGPNTVGELFALLFPVALIQLLEWKGRGRATTILMGEILLLTALTFSRGTYIMLCLMYIVLLLVTKQRVLAAVLPAVVIVIGLSLNLESSRTFKFHEIDADINGYSNADSLRAATYLNMARHVGRDPVGTGIGADFLRYSADFLRYASPSGNEDELELITFDGRPTLSQSHSAWLCVLVELGWPGGILLFLVFFAILRHLQRAVLLSRIIKDGRVNVFRAMQISVITYALTMTISDALFFDFRFAVLLWTTFGLFVSYSLQYQKSILSVTEIPPHSEASALAYAYREGLTVG